MTSNNALVPDPDKQDDLASKFWQWPLLHVGLRMCSWDDKTVKYFLLGNPLVYWGSTASLVYFALLVLYYLVRHQRGYTDLVTKTFSSSAPYSSQQQWYIDQLHYAGVYPVLGWFLHYFPFILMGRVTYVHHYYPALWFAILTMGFCVDWSLRSAPPSLARVVYALLYLGVVVLYWVFRDLSFGMVGPNRKWRHLKWLDTWRMAD